MAWLRQHPGDEQIRHPLLLSISFGRHLPAGELAGFVAVYRTAHVRRLEEYLDSARALGGADPCARATLDFDIRYERAVLDWFGHLPPALTDGDA